MQFTISEEFNAHVNKVFAAFIDIEGSKNILDGVTDSQVLEGSSPAEVGTKWKETRIMFGRESSEEMQVTQLETDKKYVVEAFSSGTKYITTHIFSETESGSKVEITFEATPESFFAKLLSPLGNMMMSSIKKAFLEDMTSIKNYVEGK